MNLKQLKTMKKLIQIEKKKQEVEIVNISHKIKEKENYINKIKEYKLEYEKQDKNKLSKAIPILYKNYDHFIIKMNEMIHKETIEINHLSFILQSMKSSLLTINKKFDLFDRDVESEILKLENKKEAVYLESIVDICASLNTKDSH